MADTATTLITDALLEIGVLADDETPSSSQVQTGLRKLNNLIDSWNIENLMVYGATSYVIPLAANTGTYTIGTGGTLNIARPNYINSAYIRDLSLSVANRLDYPVYIFTNEEWQNVPFKGLTAPYPYQGVWFDSGFPLITAYVNPVPNTSNYGLVIWVDGLISSLTANDVINLAPGYKRALISNLAVEWSPAFGVQPSQVTVEVARRSKYDLKTKNFQLNELQVSPDLRQGQWDYRTGYWT